MDWRRVSAATHRLEDDDDNDSDATPHVRVLLRPGDLMVMHDAARYDWTHGCGGRLRGH
jgi:alkylated DNA repair dioxygenase AlkB